MTDSKAAVLLGKSKMISQKLQQKLLKLRQKYSYLYRYQYLHGQKAFYSSIT